MDAMSGYFGYTVEERINRFVYMSFYADMEIALSSLEQRELCCEDRIAELTAELDEQAALLYRIQCDKHRLINDYSLDQKEQAGER
jgi:hypothetical protein